MRKRGKGRDRYKRWRTEEKERRVEKRGGPRKGEKEEDRREKETDRE